MVELVVASIWLPNDRAWDDKETARTPTPARLIVCGLLLALSEIVIVPVKAPGAVGVNVALIAQVFFAATELPQVLVCEKLPVTATLLIVRGTEPVFSKVMFLLALAVFTIWLPKE
jgi:hypothetical protein